MKTRFDWDNYIKELANLCFFWIFGIIFFLIFRITFISLFHEQIGDTFSISEMSKVLYMGFRFDCTIVSYFLILPFLLLQVLSKFNLISIVTKVRIVLQYLFVIISTLIYLATLNYFSEYNDQFNNFLFLALYDDQKAVISTIIEDFHPILNTLSFIFISIAGILIFKYFEKGTNIHSRLIIVQSKYAKITLITLSLIIFFIGMRGSFTRVPAIRKWAAVSSDTFMNKTVINPFRSFKYALKDFTKLNLIDGKNPYLKEDAFRHDYPQKHVSDIIKKVAKGTTTEKPKQIFLVIMESYDSWPLMDKYLPFELSSNLNKIAENGTHFTHFLPASKSTFNSLGAIVTGVPYCGVNISKIGKVNKPFISSIFSQFKKLGYRTNLFYGGYLSWQNIGEFSKYQGADQVFSGLDAKDKAGVWGVEDEELFDLVLENTNPNEYSLNVILTSSYHAPYSINIYEKGFPYKSENDLPQEMKKYFDNGMTMEQLGHLWYGDKAIGGFMEKSKAKYPDGLYAFTGDHFGRRFINYNPNLYERSSVPFILYGNNIPKSKNLTPGSHIDIIPTLLEITAPKGFEYYSFGTSLFSSNKKESIAHNKVIIQNDIFYFPTDRKIEKINLSNYNETKIEGKELMKNHNKIMSLAWYYTMKGDQIN